MNYKKILFLALIFIFHPIGYAQTYEKDTNPLKSPAFQSGEFLEYLVSYKVGFLNVDVATVRFDITDTLIKNKQAFHIKAVGQVRPKYTWFFNLHDIYNTYLDKTTLQPIYFNNDISENEYKFKSSYDYDWTNKIIKTTARNLQWDSDKIREFPLTDESYDAVALFFNLRSISFDYIKEDTPFTLEVVFHDKVRKIQCCFEGAEKKDIKGIGNINCLKFRCQLANADGQSFKDGSHFYLWISNDKNKVPIFVDSPIRVGSVRVRISRYSNLKFSGLLPIN